MLSEHVCVGTHVCVKICILVHICVKSRGQSLMAFLRSHIPLKKKKLLSVCVSVCVSICVCVYVHT